MDDFDFDKIWNDVSTANESSSLKLTDDQLEETTNEYEIINATAYYAHICKLLELLYHSKLGRKHDQPLDIKTLDEDYDYQFLNK